MPRAIPLKVIDERGRVVPQITKVHRLAADLQQKKPVEHLEQLAGRLMDGAQDGLPSLVRELTQERDDSPSALRVQTRCRLVEEEKETRLFFAPRAA